MEYHWLPFSHSVFAYNAPLTLVPCQQGFVLVYFLPENSKAAFGTERVPLDAYDVPLSTSCLFSSIAEQVFWFVSLEAPLLLV